MQPDKANGPKDIVDAFAKWFCGECDSPPSWKIVQLVILRKPDASAEKALRGFRAVALM